MQAFDVWVHLPCEHRCVGTLETEAVVSFDRAVAIEEAPLDELAVALALAPLTCLQVAVAVATWMLDPSDARTSGRGSSTRSHTPCSNPILNLVWRCGTSNPWFTINNEPMSTSSTAELRRAQQSKVTSFTFLNMTMSYGQSLCTHGLVGRGQQCILSSRNEVFIQSFQGPKVPQYTFALHSPWRPDEELCA